MIFAGDLGGFLPPAKPRPAKERPKMKILEKKAGRGHVLQVSLTGLTTADKRRARRYLKYLNESFAYHEIPGATR